MLQSRMKGILDRLMLESRMTASILDRLLLPTSAETESAIKTKMCLALSVMGLLLVACIDVQLPLAVPSISFRPEVITWNSVSVALMLLLLLLPVCFQAYHLHH